MATVVNKIRILVNNL